MGTTNPPAATMGTAINQTSYSRLLSLNAIDDLSVQVAGSFTCLKLRSCIFGPPTPGATIGDTEELQVAYCVRT